MTINITLFRNTLFVAYVEGQPMFDGNGCWCNEEIKGTLLSPPDLIIFGARRADNPISFEETADIIRSIVPRRVVTDAGVKIDKRATLELTPSEERENREAKALLHKHYPFGLHFIYEGQAYKVTRLSSLSKQAKRRGPIELSRLDSSDVVSFGAADMELTKQLMSSRFVTIADEAKARTSFSKTFARMFASMVSGPENPTPDVRIFNMGNLNKHGAFQL